METEWTKFKNGIYNKTSDGKGKAMIKELNLLKDVQIVEVYFYNNHSIEIKLEDYEIKDVSSFEEYLKKNGILISPKRQQAVLSCKDFIKKLIYDNRKDFVLVNSNQNFDSCQVKTLDKFGIKSKDGIILSKTYVPLLRKVNGFGIVDNIEYEDLSKGNVDGIL